MAEKTISEMMDELDKLADEEIEEQTAEVEKVKEVEKKVSAEKKVDKMDELQKQIDAMKEAAFMNTPEGQVYASLKTKLPSITPATAIDIAKAYSTSQAEIGRTQTEEKKSGKLSGDEKFVANLLNLSSEDFKMSRDLRKSINPKEQYIGINIDGTLEAYDKEGIE